MKHENIKHIAPHIGHRTTARSVSPVRVLRNYVHIFRFLRKMNKYDGLKSSRWIQNYFNLSNEQETKNKTPFWWEKDTELTSRDIPLFEYSVHQRMTERNLEADLSLVSLGHHPSAKKQNALHFLQNGRAFYRKFLKWNESIAICPCHLLWWYELFLMKGKL